MEGPVKSKKKIVPVIIVVFALIAIVLIVFLLTGNKTKETSNPIPISFENYDSLLSAEVQGYSVTLDKNGYIILNLDSSEYLLHYTLNPCTNPSERLDYSRTGPDGKEVSYDPLKEKIVITGTTAQKQSLSEVEKENALITEKIYVVGIEPGKNIAMSKSGTTTFNAEENIKFLFESKCNDANLVLKLYRI